MLEILSLVLVIYLAWNIGGNDVANSVGISYGSGALKLRHALLLAAVFEILGVMLLSYRVNETVASGISASGNPFLLLLIPALWLSFVSFKKIPVSATQAVLGAVVGYGLVEHTLNVKAFSLMFLGWLIGPLAAFVWSFSLIRLLSGLRKGFTSVKEWMGNQRYLIIAQIISSALLAFAHGSNNAGLAIGPVYTAENPFVLAALAGFAMALGILTIGSGVVRTVGRGITFLTPLSGFVSQISAASVILFFSVTGIPVSTTHIVVSSIAGVGKGRIKTGTLARIFLYGFLTLPVTAFLTGATLILMRSVFP
ncbi:MAG: inorganic phosphate transporter [Candidatus Micrarchaeota archaeon]|nr:inorganic phosphate transporter [Candidatus Micrarchaeota archaeon]